MTETMFAGLVSAIENSGPVGCCTIGEREAKAIARAALRAIREPSEDVIALGAEANRQQTYQWHMDANVSEQDEAAAGAIYTAMIDAILSQSQEGK